MKLPAVLLSLFEYEQDFHNNRHGRARRPDARRWLWRDER